MCAVLIGIVAGLFIVFLGYGIMSMNNFEVGGIIVGGFVMAVGFGITALCAITAKGINDDSKWPDD